MEEIWKPVEGFGGRVEVSNLGRVRNIDLGLTYSQHSSGNTKYLRVGIRYKGMPKKMLLVHRLVAQAFIPNPEGKKTVNHKDGDCTNNCVGNLEWMTQKENNAHAYENGLKSSEHLRVVSPEKVRLIRENYRAYCPVNGATPLAKRLGLTISQVHRIARGIHYN